MTSCHTLLFLTQRQSKHTHIAYQKSATAFDVPQGYGNIQKHDGIADYNSEDITVTFTI